MVETATHDTMNRETRQHACADSAISYRSHRAAWSSRRWNGKRCRECYEPLAR